MFMNSPALPKGNLVLQKVVSFKCFETREKCRLQLAYPFLSPEQIKGKIRDRWNKLSDEEKQNYTTYKLDKTPKKKSETGSSKKSASAKKKRKALFKIGSPKAKEKKLDICDTPEYVNTQKLKDFRSLHSKCYENDFSESSLSSTISAQSPLFKEDTVRKYIIKGNIGMKLKTPDCKKMSTQGILRNSDSGKKLQKGRVSFHCPKDTNNNYQAEVDHFDRRDSSEEEEDDDDDERFLIRREDVDFGNDTENNQGSDLPVENKSKSGDNFKHAKTEKIQHLDYQEQRENSTNAKETSVYEFLEETDRPVTFAIESKESGSQQSSSSLFDNDGVFKSPLPNSALFDRPNTRSKKKKLTPDISKIENQKSSQITPLVSDNQLVPDDYTTPQMDAAIQQFALVQALKAPEKLKQTKDGVNVAERMQARHTGRQVNRSLLSTENRDVVVEKDKLHQTVENVRNKRKSNDSSKKCTSDKTEEPSQISTVKRKKTDASNKYSKQERQLSVREESSFKVDDNPEQYSSRGNKDLNNNVIPNENLAITDMNPSGDASGSYCRFNQGNRSQKSKKKKDDQKARDSLDLRNKKELSQCKKLAESDELHGSCEYYASNEQDEEASRLEETMDSSPSYFSMQELTELKEKIEQKRAHNPALERTLKLLQLTAASYADPESTSFSTDDGKDLKLSPQLLSPALSGVSELSSVSSSLSSKTDDLTLNAQTSEGNGLCQLFEDLTPPDKKTEGLYKTQRLLRSSSHQKNIKLKDFLFEDEDIFT